MREHCFSERRGQPWLGPPLLPTSCLKRGYVVWSTLSPFLSEIISCPETGKQGQESSWEGWLGPKKEGGPLFPGAWVASHPGWVWAQRSLQCPGLDCFLASCGHPESGRRAENPGVSTSLGLPGFPSTPSSFHRD